MIFRYYELYSPLRFEPFYICLICNCFYFGLDSLSPLALPTPPFLTFSTGPPPGRSCQLRSLPRNQPYHKPLVPPHPFLPTGRQLPHPSLSFPSRPAASQPSLLALAAPAPPPPRGPSCFFFRLHNERKRDDGIDDEKVLTKIFTYNLL